MNRRTLGLTTICTTFIAGTLLVGCEYPEDEVSVPQDERANQAAEQAPGSGLNSDSPALQGRNSVLGKAMDQAEGVVGSAEQASQNTANEADKLLKPGG